MLTAELFQSLQIGDLCVAGIVRREASGAVAHEIELPGGYDGVTVVLNGGGVALAPGDEAHFAVGDRLMVIYDGGYWGYCPVSLVDTQHHWIGVNALVGYGGGFPATPTPVTVYRQWELPWTVAAAKVAFTAALATGAATIDFLDGAPGNLLARLALQPNEPCVTETAYAGTPARLLAHGDGNLKLALLYESTS